MIKGMTGFGSAEARQGNVRAIIEVKSLNHRYFDVSFHLPIGFAAIENKIRQLMQKEVERGRVTISIKIIDKPHQTIILNKDVVQTHLKYANQLKREFKVENNLRLSDLVKLPGVLETKETLVDAKKIWPALNKGLTKAVKDLVKMRKSEGTALAKDVSDKLRRMSAQIKTIQAQHKKIIAAQKKKLTHDELASFQKGADVNEEISRLKHYVDEIKALLKSNSTVGKKIDFIAQEMQRETNTIGSKLQDKVVSNAVIALKSKVEKIREQAQNIE